MKKILIILLQTVVFNMSLIAQLDYRNDNVIYKTLYPKDLRGVFKQQSQYLVD